MALTSLEQISDLKIWYDCSDLSTITEGGSSVIASIANKASDPPDGSSDLAVMAGEQAPDNLGDQNELNCVLFGGLDGLSTPAFTDFTSGGPVTVFCVMVPTGALANDFYYAGEDSATNDLNLFYAGSACSINRGNSTPNATINRVLDQVESYATVYKGANSYVTANRFDQFTAPTGAASPGTNPVTGISIGASAGGFQGFTGKFCEFAVFNRELLPFEINVLHDYALGKWDANFAQTNVPGECSGSNATITDPTLGADGWETSQSPDNTNNRATLGADGWEV